MRSLRSRSILPPPSQDFVRLSRLADGYPASRDELIWTAKEQGFGGGMVQFLELFAESRVFRDEDDFVAAAEELSILVGEEQHGTAEHLRSPQD